MTLELSKVKIQGGGGGINRVSVSGWVDVSCTLEVYVVVEQKKKKVTPVVLSPYFIISFYYSPPPHLSNTKIFFMLSFKLLLSSWKSTI